MFARAEPDLHAERDSTGAAGDEHRRDSERSESGDESGCGLRLAEGCDEQHERHDHDEAFEQRAHSFTLVRHPLAVSEFSPWAHLTIAGAGLLYNQLLI